MQFLNLNGWRHLWAIQLYSFERIHKKTAVRLCTAAMFPPHMDNMCEQHFRQLYMKKELSTQ